MEGLEAGRLPRFRRGIVTTWEEGSGRDGHSLADKGPASLSHRAGGRPPWQRLLRRACPSVCVQVQALVSWQLTAFIFWGKGAECNLKAAGPKRCFSYEMTGRAREAATFGLSGNVCSAGYVCSYHSVPTEVCRLEDKVGLRKNQVEVFSIPGAGHPVGGRTPASPAALGLVIKSLLEALSFLREVGEGQLLQGDPLAPNHKGRLQ